jgi:hypothetical protein
MCDSYLCQYTYRCTITVQDNIIFKYVGLVTLYSHISYFTMNYNKLKPQNKTWYISNLWTLRPSVFNCYGLLWMSLKRLKIEHVRKAWWGRGERRVMMKLGIYGYRVWVLLVTSLIDDNFRYFHRTTTTFVIKLTVGCYFSINIKSFNDI